MVFMGSVKAKTKAKVKGQLSRDRMLEIGILNARMWRLYREYDKRHEVGEKTYGVHVEAVFDICKIVTSSELMVRSDTNVNMDTEGNVDYDSFFDDLKVKTVEGYKLMVNHTIKKHGLGVGRDFQTYLHEVERVISRKREIYSEL